MVPTRVVTISRQRSARRVASTPMRRSKRTPRKTEETEEPDPALVRRLDAEPLSRGVVVDGVLTFKLVTLPK